MRAGPRRLLVTAAVVAAALAAPFVVYPIFLMKLLCFALFASAFNLLLGYAGLLSIGHAAFFGGAAYVTAHAIKVWDLTPELGILLGTAAAALLGVVFGAIAIRRQGIYFAMITLALSQMVFFVALQVPFTGGEDGIQGVHRGRLLGLLSLEDPLALYLFVLAVFTFGLLAIHRIIHSPFGQVLKAIRDNEPRMVSLGYSVDRYKLLAFTLSAALAGLAGATKTLVFQLASLTDIQWQMSGEVIIMTILGGLGTVTGPFVGALLVLTIETYLAATEVPVTILTGAVFVIVVLLFRRGIVGEIRALSRRRRAR